MKKLMLMFTFVCIVAYSCKKEDSGNAPNCEILIPLNNTQIIAGQIIDISVGAVDQNGTITDVRIFIAGEERASFSSEPYTYSWNTKTETIGEKQIQARCTDNDGNQTQATIMVTIITGTLPPVANFSADVTTGLNPLEVKFSDGTEFNPSTWQWNFGDGNSSTEQNPVHIYADYGVYSVTLTVTNSAGSDALTKYDYIHVVNNNIPIADFSVNAREAYNPFWAYFVDQSQNEPTSWEWEFGDGQGSTDQHPLHIYENPGFYSIKLTASNSYGSDEMFFQDYITILSAGSPNGTMTDPRDGKIYNTTQIGEQVWFAENLSYDIDAPYESFFYENDAAIGSVYGRLYPWTSALAACPEGWHLPGKGEWDAMVDFLGEDGIAFKLMEPGLEHWGYNSTFTSNSSGFTALPGGYENGTGQFGFLTTSGWFWTSTESIDLTSVMKLLDNNELKEEIRGQSIGLSVRCVKD